MNKDEVIADRIEEVMHQMFSAFNSFEPKPLEYAIFYNAAKSKTWFILVYFKDSFSLKGGIKNGTCYQIHKFLTETFLNVEELRNIERSFFFEHGNRPVKPEDYDNQYAFLLKKTENLLAGRGEMQNKMCHHCGHDFDKHQLLGQMNEQIGAPTEGWIMCPEENCHCFLTWDAKYKNE